MEEYKTDVDAGVYAFTAATQKVFGRFGTGAWDHAQEHGRAR